ncbi:hypothetical protein BDZ89DRAFT_1158956, partial [Hymenopellis radicata]
MAPKVADWVGQEILREDTPQTRLPARRGTSMAGRRCDKLRDDEIAAPTSSPAFHQGYGYRYHISPLLRGASSPDVPSSILGWRGRRRCSPTSRSPPSLYRYSSSPSSSSVKALVGMQIFCARSQTTTSRTRIPFTLSFRLSLPILWTTSRLRSRTRRVSQRFRRRYADCSL